jgi:hypothetical protein
LGFLGREEGAMLMKYNNTHRGHTSKNSPKSYFFSPNLLKWNIYLANNRGDGIFSKHKAHLCHRVYKNCEEIGVFSMFS